MSKSVLKLVNAFVEFKNTHACQILHIYWTTCPGEIQRGNYFLAPRTRVNSPLTTPWAHALAIFTHRAQQINIKFIYNRFNFCSDKIAEMKLFARPLPTVALFCPGKGSSQTQVVQGYIGQKICLPHT